MAGVYPMTLRHPVHGVKVAYLEAEAENDKLSGWVEDIAPLPRGANALATKKKRKKRTSKKG